VNNGLNIVKDKKMITFDCSTIFQISFGIYSGTIWKVSTEIKSTSQSPNKTATLDLYLLLQLT